MNDRLPTYLRRELFTCLLVVLVAPMARGQCSYTYASIPNLPGWVARGTAINNLGHVAGNLQSGGANSRAFVWSPETGTVQLPLPPGMIDMRVHDLNELGHAVGYMTSTTEWFGFFWDGEQYTIIDRPAWATNIEATGINNLDQVVGTASNTTTTGEYRAFLWESGAYFDLGPTISPERSEAEDIDELGRIAGSAGNSWIADYRGFQLDQSQLTWLLQPPELATVRVLAMSNNGFFVGDAWIESPAHYVGVVWTPDGPHVVAPPKGGARDVHLKSVNDAGRAVGYYDRPARGPIVWQDGHVTELRSLVIPNPPAGLVFAFDINNSGQIVAHADVGTVVLNPVWLPADLTGDCAVTLDDLLLVLSNFGSPAESYPRGDVDLDGDVDLSDLTILLAHWGQ